MKEEVAEVLIAGRKVHSGSEGAMSGAKAMDSALALVSDDVSKGGPFVPLTIELLGASMLPFAIGKKRSFVVCRCARCSRECDEMKPTNDKKMQNEEERRAMGRMVCRQAAVRCFC